MTQWPDGRGGSTLAPPAQGGELVGVGLGATPHRLAQEQDPVAVLASDLGRVDATPPLAVLLAVPVEQTGAGEGVVTAAAVRHGGPRPGGLAACATVGHQHRNTTALNAPLRGGDSSTNS